VVAVEKEGSSKLENGESSEDPFDAHGKQGKRARIWFEIHVAGYHRSILRFLFTLFASFELNGKTLKVP
jgi:hypothetical protein